MVSSWWGSIVCGNILRGDWSLRGLAGGEWAQCGLWIMNTGFSSIWRGHGVPGQECYDPPQFFSSIPIAPATAPPAAHAPAPAPAVQPIPVQPIALPQPYIRT